MKTLYLVWDDNGNTSTLIAITEVKHIADKIAETCCRFKPDIRQHSVNLQTYEDEIIMSRQV